MSQLTNELSAVPFVIFHVFVQRKKARNAHWAKPRMYGVWKSFHAFLGALINQSLCFLAFLYAAFLHWKITIAPYQRSHTTACQNSEAIYKWELRFFHVPKIDSETLGGKKETLNPILKAWLFSLQFFWVFRGMISKRYKGILKLDGCRWPVFDPKKGNVLSFQKA